MNSMPGAGGVGGSGGAGGYGGGGGGGLPGGMPGGQQPGVPVDHQQQQQQMMMARQQQMAYMQHQQQQAAAARGMMQPGMQQHPSMMQQSMYGMQQQQQPGGAGGMPAGMDPAAMQRYQQAHAARQQQMQQMQQQPGVHQQQMLEKLRNLPPEERNARLQALSATRGGAYPPGMHPMAGGHMGGPAQPGSSGMGMAATSAAGAVGGAGGGMPSHYIKQEPLGAGAGGGGGVAGGASGGMMGAGGHPGGAPHLMNVKQEQGLHSIKQEPGVASSSAMGGGHHPMQQQHGEDGGSGSNQPHPSAMQHMQQQPQGMPVSMQQQQARMQQARQAAAMRGMSQQQAAAAAAAASMQGGAPSGQELSVGQHMQQQMAAKQAAAAAAAGGGGGGHPQHMQQQQPQSMQHMDMHQRMIFQQHQHMQHQQQLQQQQGMSMAQIQAQHHAARQQMAGGAATAAAAAGAMGPPPMQQQQPQPAAAPAAPAAAPAPPPPDDQEEVKLFKKKVDALKASHGSIVERFWNRATPGESMPKFITVCRDLFSGAMSYSRSNMITVSKLELHLDLYLERQSVTAGIMTALDSVIRAEKDAKERAEMEDVKPAVAAAGAGPSSRLLPDPWPLDVRARRVRVPDGLAKHVRSKQMDERLISRRKRHADVMREEEGLPLWSARRMRHEVDLDKELDELEKVDSPGALNGVRSKINNPNHHWIPPTVVNSVPKSESMEHALEMRRKFGNPFPNETRMPQEALKELSVLQWTMITEDRQHADAGNFLVSIQIGLTAIPQLHVLIPGEYPKRPAAILFERSFPKSHGPIRRLGEMMEARLATVPISTQGRITTIASVYKDVCESFFSASRSVREQMALSRGPRRIIEQSPSPQSSASSSTSTSPAEQPQPTETPPIGLHSMLQPVLNHPPATYRPQPKFRPSVEGGAKSRMVY